MLSYCLQPQSGNWPTLGVKSCLFTKPKELEASFRVLQITSMVVRPSDRGRTLVYESKFQVCLGPLTLGKSPPWVCLLFCAKGKLLSGYEKRQIRTCHVCLAHSKYPKMVTTIILRSPFTECPHEAQRFRAPHRIHGCGGGRLTCTCHEKRPYTLATANDLTRANVQGAFTPCIVKYFSCITSLKPSHHPVRQLTLHPYFIEEEFEA